MKINIGMSECDKNVDDYYSSHVTVWIPCCAGQEANDDVEPLHGFACAMVRETHFSSAYSQHAVN